MQVNPFCQIQMEGVGALLLVNINREEGDCILFCLVYADYTIYLKQE